MINLTFHRLMFRDALDVNQTFVICVKGGLCWMRVCNSSPHLTSDDFWPTCQTTEWQVNLMDNAREATWLWAGVTSARWHFDLMDAQFFEYLKSVKSVYLLKTFILNEIKQHYRGSKREKWRFVILAIGCFTESTRVLSLVQFNQVTLAWSFRFFVKCPPTRCLARWIYSAKIFINIFDATFLVF